MKFWAIIEVNEEIEYDGKVERLVLKPTPIYDTLDDAERALLRLTQRLPDAELVIIESVSTIHKNLGGLNIISNIS